MKKIINLINKHLISLQLKKNDNIVVHSDISKFGIYSYKLPELIIKNLLKIIGKNGTLVMPLYYFSNESNFYDKKKDYSDKENSILSKYFFQKFNPHRSFSIMHSHLLKGKLSNLFLKKKNYNSFGINSDFNIFKRKNFKLLLLGCEPNEGLTYIHHLEHLVKVPYRVKKIKTFYIKENNIKKISINYFVRKKGFKVNFNKLLNNKNIRKKIIISKLKFGNSYIINHKDLHLYGHKILKKNKKTLIL